MGTTYVVKLAPAGAIPPAELQALQSAIADAIGGVTEAMSTYLPESELSRFNSAPANESFGLSPATLEVFLAAAESGELTGGALDPTVGPLVNAWGFGPGARRDLTDAEVEDLRSRLGWDKLVLDPDNIRKTVDGVECDLSAIAKGYAVDQVSEALNELGQTNHMP